MQPAALIIVNYHSASLAIEAIRSARATTALPLSVVVVDNSVDAAEVAAIRPHADHLIAAERNLGYGAAINRARKHCDVEVLVVSNADVVFGEGAIDRLVATRASVSGPALFWDDEFRWSLPPSELHTNRQVIDRVIATRSRIWARARDRRRIRERIAFHALRTTTPVRALSGAVLAIRSDRFDEAQGFDERFELYFEENDFLRRVRGDIVYVPDARCRHIYNQSAANSSQAEMLYAASEQKYLEKWSGALVRNFRRFERPAHEGDAIAIGDGPIATPPNSWIEASPVPDFDAAAGRMADSTTVEIPQSVWRAYRGDSLYLRVIDPLSAMVLATYARSKMNA